MQKSSGNKKELIKRIDFFPWFLVCIAFISILSLIPLGKSSRDNLKERKMEKKIDKYIQDELILCGDSYSGFFEIFLREKYNYNKVSYHCAGHTIFENETLYMQAIESPYKIIIFTTSVNDHFRQTKTEDFRKELNKILQLSKVNNKIIVMHSFMSYDYKKVKEDAGVDPSKYSIKVKEYDEIIKEEINKFDNALYIDTNDIANFDLLGDGIHYGNRFYSILYDRVLVALKEYLKNNKVVES